MNKNTYAEKLKDPRWQRKRLEVLNRDNFMCQYCGALDKTLHVHHKMYEGEPWDVPIDALVTLCYECHELEASERRQYSVILTDTIMSKPFMADDMRELASGINDIILQDKAYKVMRVYSWAFSNPDIQRMLIGLFNERY